MKPQTYQAILFDFDGVLVDSEPIHLACWMEALAPYGIRVDWDTYRTHYIGIDDRAMLQSWCALVDPPVSYDEAWAKYPLKKQLFEDRMHSTDVVSAGVRSALERLHRTHKLAVVTSSARSEIEPILIRGGLLEHLDTVVYGGEANRPKPAPDPYLLAAERLGVKDALVVEDSAAGLEAGRAAGFDVVAVPQQSEMLGLLEAALSAQQKPSR